MCVHWNASWLKQEFGLFPELNKDRLKYLFRTGLSRPRIKRFLDDRKGPLMMQGAQYRRRGQGAEADIAFLVGLPDKCASMVRSSCLEGLEVDASLRAEALVAQFAAIEKSTEKLSPESARRFAELGLVYLFQENPPESWLAFLKTPIGEAGAAQENAEPTESVEPTVAATDAGMNGKLFGALMEVLRKLREDDGDGARASIALFPQSALRVELEELVGRHRARAREAISLARPLRTLDSTDGLDSERVAILLQRTRPSHPDQPAFLDIRGLFLDTSLYTLTEDQSLELFEHPQHIIGFPDQRGLRLPVLGELCLWYVEKYPTDKPIKYRLRKPAAALHIVVPLAASLDEPDRVRTGIQGAAIETWVRPIFQLAGGEFLRIATEAQNPARTNLEQPLQYYRSLPAWDLMNMGVVVGPMPPSDGEYDCADLSAVTGRILRESEARRQLPALTKAQVGAFVEALRASDMGLTEQRLTRIAREFEQYVASAECLEQVAVQILGSGHVAAVIETARREAAEQIRTQSKQLRDERSRLEREIGELKERRSVLVDENKRTGEEVRNVVRKTFEKAKAAGARSLGELAVFGALMQREPSVDSSVAEGANSISVSHAERTEDAQKALVDVGVSIPNARVMATAARCIAASGLPLLVVGARAAQIAAALGRGLAEGRCVIGDIPVGIVDTLAMRRFIDCSTAVDSIVFRNHNLSAFEAYGSPLMDALVPAAVSGQPMRAAVVLSAARGVAALPLDADLSSLSVVIDASADLAAEAPELRPVLEGLLEDRSATRTRSAALARLLDDPDGHSPSDTNAILALVASQDAVLLKTYDTGRQAD